MFLPHHVLKPYAYARPHRREISQSFWPIPYRLYPRYQPKPQAARHNARQFQSQPPPCTAAVETEIDAHYAAQLEALADSEDKADKELAKKIEKFRADEAAHKHTALEHGAEETPGFEAMSRLIRFGCRVAIRASEKI